MPITPRQPPPSMTVAEFIHWPGDGTGCRSQLIDGVAHILPPGTATRGLIQTNLICLVENRLVESGGAYCGMCRPPTVPRVRASLNLRTPAVGVAGVPDSPDEFAARAPILLIEILTPEEAPDIRRNIWAYCTIPSVREIAIVDGTRTLVELWRRGSDGHWPEGPARIGRGDTLRLESIGLSCSLEEVYDGTDLVCESMA